MKPAATEPSDQPQRTLKSVWPSTFVSTGERACPICRELTASSSGNVHRLTDEGAAQAPFLARTFARTRLRTHATEFRPALGDRTAWNKLFRRAFWEEHALRFPDGVLHDRHAMPGMLALARDGGAVLALHGVAQPV